MSHGTVVTDSAPESGGRPGKNTVTSGFRPRFGETAYFISEPVTSPPPRVEPFREEHQQPGHDPFMRASWHFLFRQVAVDQLTAHLARKEGPLLHRHGAMGAASGGACDQHAANLAERD
jgi:hypothetical protein